MKIGKNLKNRLIKSLSLVAFSTFLNILTAFILLPLTVSSLNTEDANFFYLALLALGLSQALDAVRYPLISMFDESPNVDTSRHVSQALSFMFILCSLLVVISLFSSTFWGTTLWVIPVFITIGFTSIFWAVTDKYILSGLGHFTRNMSIFLFFLLCLFFDTVNPFILLSSVLLLNFMVILVISIKALDVAIIIKKSKHSRTPVLNNRFFATLTHYIISVIQSNGERIILLSAPKELFNAVSFFSEIANKLSFIPRSIYSAAFPVLSGRKMLISLKTNLWLSVSVLFLMLASYLALQSIFYGHLLLFVPTNYHPYIDLFIVLISLSFLKVLGYFSVFVLNISGNFHSQILTNVFCIIPILISLALDVDSIQILTTIIVLIKSTDIALFIVANFKNNYE